MKSENKSFIYTKFEMQPSSLSWNVFLKLPGLVMRCLEKGAILAGGAIRSIILNETPSDYDLYFLSQESYDRCRLLLSGSGGYDGFGRVIVTTSKNSETFDLQGFLSGKDNCKIQLIRTRIYRDVEDVMLNFDFTVCQAALTVDQTVEERVIAGVPFIKRYTLFTSVNFLPDLISKKLSLSPDYNIDNVLEAPACRGSRRELNIMARYLKYIGKGYIPTKGTTSSVFRHFVTATTGKDEKYVQSVINCIEDTNYIELYDSKTVEALKEKSVVVVPTKTKLEPDDTEDEYDPYECPCCNKEDKGQP